MGLMSGVLGTHGHAWGPRATGHVVESHWARGNSGTLLHQKVGLEPQDMCRYQSPAGRWSWCLGHVATPEPSYAGAGLEP
jgi:hypothetical protein